MAGRLARQISEVLTLLEACGARHALIGGLAVAAHGVPRATQDVDLLVGVADLDALHPRLLAAGYQCLHRSGDAANYLRGSERLDVLIAHRPLAMALLERAKVLDTPLGRLPVVGVEGLIGFKLQALANDPSRVQDLADIRALVHLHREGLDRTELRGYFELFDRSDLYDELLAD